MVTIVTKFVPYIVILVVWFLIKLNESVAMDLKLIAIPVVWSVLFFIIKKTDKIVFFNSFVLFALYYVSHVINFGNTSTKTQLALSLCGALPFLITSLVNKIGSRTPKINRVIGTVVYSVSMMLPVIYLGYNIQFGTYVTREVLFAMSQTNILETIEFVGYYKMLWFVISAFCGYVILVYLYQKVYLRNVMRERVNPIIVILNILLIGAAGYSVYSSSLSTFALNAVAEYNEELRRFKEVQSKVRDELNLIEANKKEENETYVVVIGESLNKNHMSAYGYFRNTTPRLSARLKNTNMVQITDAVSAHTLTMQTLSQVLTEANQDNEKDYFSSFSVLDVLKKAGVKSYWITNQYLYGKWDNLVSVIAHGADSLISINRGVGSGQRTQKYDEVLIPLIKSILSETSKKSRVIFVHLMGSHLNYCERYPKSMNNQFVGELKVGEFGKLFPETDEHTVNCYDNSVMYNDIVLDSILTVAQNIPGVSSVLYLPDHGEDVFTGKFHNSGLFSFDMTQIPMWVWFSDAYLKKYPGKVLNIKRNRKKLFTNDYAFDTMLDLIGVVSPIYEKRRSLLDSTYILDAKEAKTLLGKKQYIDSSNYHYWQKHNSEYLRTNSLMGRVYPHRVNSLGKLKDMWNKGFRSVEIDVVYHQRKNEFFLSHDWEFTGATLKEFLDAIPVNQLKNIWLDMKNLSEVNVREMLTKLEELDELYAIKSKVLFETTNDGQLVKQISDKGWHTMFTVSPKRVLNLLKNEKSIEMEELAFSINNQIALQGVKSVSFVKSLYPWVKMYLEPLLIKPLTYHTWKGPELWRVNFISNLQQEEYYNDERVHSILIDVYSPFNL